MNSMTMCFAVPSGRLMRAIAIGFFMAVVWGACAASEAWAIPTSNLELWLNADNVAGANGSTVSTWTDASGNGNDAVDYSGPASTHPTLQTGLYSGHNALRFTNATALRNNTIASLNDMTVFAVYKWNSLSNQNWYLSFGSYDPEFGVGSQSTHLSVYDTSYQQYNALAQTTDHLYRSMFVRSGGNQNTFTLEDGSTQTLAFAYSATAGSYQLASQQFGAINGTANIDLAELIVYNGTLSLQDQQAVLSYLAFKFDPPPAPEPSSLLLLAGVLGLSIAKRRRR